MPSPLPLSPPPTFTALQLYPTSLSSFPPSPTFPGPPSSSLSLPLLPCLPHPGLSSDPPPTGSSLALHFASLHFASPFPSPDLVPAPLFLFTPFLLSSPSFPVTLFLLSSPSIPLSVSVSSFFYLPFCLIPFFFISHLLKKYLLLPARTPLRLLSCHSLLLLACAQTRLPFIAL